ncbi:MAG TPA: glycosyltransferase family 4 protein [Gaiellaceae bacterium]|nr:glycosyltransferase family 4 protein [Gaiellaceae bacterium]
MKVAHVHRIGGIGGSERHVLTLLPALAAKGVDVRFVGLDMPGADPFYEELGVPYERLTHAWQLRRALQGAELVHTHLVHADVFGALTTRKPTVSTKHNPDPFRAGPWRFAERALARRARRIVAISEAVRRFNVDEVGLPEKKIEVVHYGLDALPEPWGENPELPIRKGSPLLLCVARLAPQKGVDTAIRALASIPEATLLVLGEGPERATLEALARELAVADRVLMPGRVGDIAAFYRRCDVVVHPARWEGFGLAMLEGMLAAKPVVAARAGSAPEIVADGMTGLLVPPDDPHALAAAVTSMLADRQRAEMYGTIGLGRARAQFSVERMAQRTLAVYERAASSR